MYSDGSTETVVSYTDPSSRFFGSLFYIYNISHPISEDSNPIIGNPGTLIVLSAAMMRQTLFLAQLSPTRDSQMRDAFIDLGHTQGKKVLTQIFYFQQQTQNESSHPRRAPSLPVSEMLLLPPSSAGHGELDVAAGQGSSTSPDGGARPWGARPCCAAPPQVAALHRATRRPWEARLRRPWGAQRRRPWGARPRRMEEPVHGRARRQTEQRPLAHHYERFLVCVSSTRDLFLPLVVMGTQNGCSVCVCCWRPVWIGKTTVRDAKCIWVTVWVCCWRQPCGSGQW